MCRTARIRPAGIAISAALLLLALAAPAQAQLLRGRVVLASDSTPLRDVAILVFRGATPIGAAESDSTGSFQLELPQPGEFTLIARRVGLMEIGPATFTAPAGRLLDVLISMSDQVIVLDPLTVEAHAVARNTLVAAQQRSADNRRLGVGTHMSRAEIEASGRTMTADVITTMSPLITNMTIRPNMVASGRGYSPVAGELPRTLLGVTRQGSFCPLSIVVDGLQLDDVSPEMLPAPHDIDTIEVYTGPHVRGGYYDRNGCGIALIWTRLDSQPSRYRRTLLGSAVLAALLGIVLLTH